MLIDAEIGYVLLGAEVGYVLLGAEVGYIFTTLKHRYEVCVDRQRHGVWVGIPKKNHFNTRPGHLFAAEVKNYFLHNVS